MKIGCDPEIFLVDAAGAFVSSIGKIGGSKENPRPLAVLGDGFAVQEDNVAIEFNIPAAGDAAELKHNIKSVREYLLQQVGTMGLAFSQLSAVIFPDEQLMHPEALVFGCDPDFSAWDGGKVNPKPRAEDWRLRSCGGHVHVGERIGNKEALIDLIKWMDLYLGVPSVLLDKGELRKQLYGKAGAYRPKPYGGEYRTLSNFWIWDDKLIDWVWKATAAAVDCWKWQDDTIIAEEGPLILQAINENNKDAAMFLCDKHNLMLNYD